MKKILVFIICLFFVGISNVDASTASINVTTNKSTVIVGETVRATVRVSSNNSLGSWSFDVNYNSSMLRLTNSPMGGGRVVDVVSGPNQKSKTYTFDFVARQSGNATISIRNASVIDYNERSLTVSTRGSSLRLMTRAELEATFSRNNYLKSLQVEGGELSPSFNRETEEYEVVMEPETTEIKISGEREDSTASVEGFGTFEVSDGSNSFEVVVSAQNGNIRTYKINVMVEELDPIELEIDGNKYTVVRKTDDVKCLDQFTDKTIEINEEEVPACFNEKSEITLVLLRDEEGETAFFVYDGEFSKFNKFTINSLLFYYMEFPSDINIPSNYSLVQRKINDVEYDVYINTDNRDFGLVYGININTGEEGLYQYDFSEDTIQRYNEIESEELPVSLVTIIVAGLLVLSSVFNIYFVTKELNKGQKRRLFKKKSS